MMLSPVRCMEFQQQACVALGVILATRFKGGESVAILAKQYNLSVEVVEFLIRNVMVVL